MLRIALPNKGRLAEDVRERLRRRGPGDPRPRRAGPHRLARRRVRGDLRPQPGHPRVRLRRRRRRGRHRLGPGLRVRPRRSTSGSTSSSAAAAWCVAAREDSAIERVEQLPPGPGWPRSSRGSPSAFFAEKGLAVEVVPVSGAAEIAPHLGIADVVVDLDQHREHPAHQRAQGDLHARRVERRASSPAPGWPPTAPARSDELEDALASVLRARGKRYLMANVPRARLEAVREVLPGLSGPTVIELTEAVALVAVHAVVSEASLYRTVAALKALGGGGHPRHPDREADAVSAPVRWHGSALRARAGRAPRPALARPGRRRGAELRSPGGRLSWPRCARAATRRSASSHGGSMGSRSPRSRSRARSSVPRWTGSPSRCAGALGARGPRTSRRVHSRLPSAGQPGRGGAEGVVVGASAGSAGPGRGVRARRSRGVPEQRADGRRARAGRRRPRGDPLLSVRVRAGCPPTSVLAAAALAEVDRVFALGRRGRHRRHGLRHRVRARGGPHRRSGQRLGGRGEAPGLLARRHRLAGGADRAAGARSMRRRTSMPWRASCSPRPSTTREAAVVAVALDAGVARRLLERVGALAPAAERSVIIRQALASRGAVVVATIARRGGRRSPSAAPPST